MERRQECTVGNLGGVWGVSMGLLYGATSPRKNPGVTEGESKMALKRAVSWHAMCIV